MVTWKSHRPAVVRKLRAAEREIVRGATDLAHDSIVHGSILTGSPGQPADLREGQWEKDSDASGGIVGTNDPSARSVEDGISHKYGGAIELKSDIGGFHSVEKTHRNFDRILGVVVQRVKR